MSRFYALLPAALAKGQPFALGIIAATKGSSPQKKGAKALFFADGQIVGTLGGGCLEAEIQDRARRALLTQTPATFELVLDHDFGWDDGLLCGGSVQGLILPRAAEAAELWHALARGDTTLSWGVRPDYSLARVPESPGAWLYQETVAPPCVLWIAGSGHVAQAVAPLAQQLDFAVTVFDDRPTWANPTCFPTGTSFRVGYWADLLREPWPTRPVFGLIVTRGHQHDALVLRDWIHRPFAFLGMIGSRRKARLMTHQFLEDGLARPEELARLACPVGLAIHAQTVPEIAVSVMAQFIQRRAALLAGGPSPPSAGVQEAPHPVVATPATPTGAAPRFGVVILAAGASTRMGQSKLLLPWAGTTVIGHLVEQWRGLGAAQVAVVTAPGAVALGAELERLAVPPTDRIVNPAPQAGMFSSIQCAAAWTGWGPGLTHWLIALGDQPHLRPGTLRRLVEFGVAHPHAICQPAAAGRPAHPVWLPERVWRRLPAATAPNLKAFLHAHADPVCLCETDDPGLAQDLDHPADYERLRP